MTPATHRATSTVTNTVSAPCSSIHRLTLALPIEKDTCSSPSITVGSTPLRCSATTPQAPKANTRSKEASQPACGKLRLRACTVRRITAIASSNGTASLSRFM